MGNNACLCREQLKIDKGNVDLLTNTRSISYSQLDVSKEIPSEQVKEVER